MASELWKQPHDGPLNEYPNHQRGSSAATSMVHQTSILGACLDQPAARGSAPHLRFTRVGG
jgi:hypothetical protein